MEIIQGIENIKRSFKNPIVTIGNFDGVHLGHQKIFERVKEESSRLDGESMVITFEPHPLKILSPENFIPILTPFHMKMRLIEETGIKTVLCINFSPAFSEINPDDFIKKILVEKLNIKKIIIGYNYHFGKDQKGDVKTLLKAGKIYFFETEVIEALKIDDVTVSSSKIRELIKDGEVEKASRLLGRDYIIVGKVIKGSGRGKDLGFPTANIEVSEQLFPKTGVYAVNVSWNHKFFNGVANIGRNPTFIEEKGEERPSFEVHILNFNQDIYSDEIQISLKKRIRDEVRFEEPSKLVEQIKNDIQWAKANAF